MATKNELVENLVKKLSYLSNDDAHYVVDCVLDQIKEELASGSRVEIRGFGTLSLRKRKYAGQDKNYNSIYYRMSKNVQEDLNNKV